MLERVDGALDQRRTVVGGNDLDPGGERRLKLVDLGLHASDDIERVFSVPRDDHRSYRLTLPVQLGEAATNVTAETNRSNIANMYRRAVDACTDRHLGKVGQVLQIAAS